MADLNLITIIPSQPVQNVHPAAQGASQAPPAIAALSVGAILQGFIINRDAGGNPIVRTDKGDFPFATSYFLKIGSEVVIRIGSTGGHTLAHLLSVDGQ